MDYRKLTLYIALIIVTLTLWNFWQREQQTPANEVSVQTSSSHGIPSLPEQSLPSPHSVPLIPSQTKVAASKVISNSMDHLITVKTDKFMLLINKQGGGIVKSTLLEYGQNQNKKEPFVLLDNDPSQLYLMQGGLIGAQGPDTEKGPVTYTSAQDHYVLGDNKKELVVDLTWQNAQGFTFVKRYIFTRGLYEIGLDYRIQNNSSHTWTIYPYAQFERKQPPSNSALFQYGLFTGAAVSSPDKHYEKLSFKNMKESALSQTITGGWVAMIQHYFLSSLVPPSGEAYHYYSSYNGDDRYTVGLMGPEINLGPHQSVNTEFKLYMGPAIADNLNAVAPYLNLTIDYGWLWFISAVLFWVMSILYKFLGNWGWSIVFLTLLIKLCFYHLSAKSYSSMAVMRRLQPRIAQIRERFGDDRQKMSQAVMELYRSEKVNPLSGCLPILVQIPFFIALYYMIIESVQLRQAPFMLWIQDLSVADPFYILPVVMGALMFVQQKLNPPAPDPMQQKVMMFLPVIFTVFFLNFPAGLVLYWITNTAVSILQQWYIMRKVNGAQITK